MKRACFADRKKVVGIISETFDKMPGVDWMLRKEKSHEKQIRHLANYAFARAAARGGAFISSNEKGAALCYKFNKKAFSFCEIFYKIMFTLNCVRFDCIPKIQKSEHYKISQRPASGEYLYFWFFGVQKNGNKAGFEIKNEIFKLADSEQLPIYAETSLKRNKIIYERFGFKTYHYYEDKDEKLNYWFMKREPHAVGNLFPA